jgi:hypothetical protein
VPTHLLCSKTYLHAPPPLVPLTLHPSAAAQPDIPSVLYDIPAIREQYQTFLLALLLSPHQGLDATQAAAAATYLLLQDRVDEAERVLGPHLGAALGGGAVGGGLDTPAAMQVCVGRLRWGIWARCASMSGAVLPATGGLQTDCSEMCA